MLDISNCDTPILTERRESSKWVKLEWEVPSIINGDEKRITVHRNSFVRSGKFDTFADRSSRTLSCPNITYRNSSRHQGTSPNATQVKILLQTLCLSTINNIYVLGLLFKHHSDIQKCSRSFPILTTSLPPIFALHNTALHLVHRALLLFGGTPYTKLLHGISRHSRACNYRHFQYNRNGKLKFCQTFSIVMQQQKIV